MDEFRETLGLVLIILMPIVLTFWIVIHAGSGFWKSQKVGVAYSVAALCILGVTLLTILNRDFLLGTDLGFSGVLFASGLIVYLMSWGLWHPVKRHLDFKTFAGVPEVTDQKIKLITDGPFAIVRHPRYLMVVIGVVGWCLMSNFSGVYAMGAVSIIGLVIVVTLEERDLSARFGDEYRAYQKSVPQLIPTISGVRQFFRENFKNRD